MPALIAAALALAGAPGAVPVVPPEGAAVLAELNVLHTTPRSYLPRLERYRRAFSDPAQAYPPPSHEGPAAVDEAMRVLATQPALPMLHASTLLDAVARDHVRAQGATATIGHGAALSPGERARAHGGDRYVGEVIVYGVATAADVVRQLMVDDGVPRRGHRVLLLSPLYRYAGVACGPHARFGTMCVIVLAATSDSGPVLPTEPPGH